MTSKLNCTKLVEIEELQFPKRPHKERACTLAHTPGIKAGIAWVRNLKVVLNVQVRWLQMPLKTKETKIKTQVVQETANNQYSEMAPNQAAGKDRITIRKSLLRLM